MSTILYRLIWLVKCATADLIFHLDHRIDWALRQLPPGEENLQDVTPLLLGDCANLDHLRTDVKQLLSNSLYYPNMNSIA